VCFANIDQDQTTTTTPALWWTDVTKTRMPHSRVIFGRILLWGRWIGCHANLYQVHDLADTVILHTRNSISLLSSLLLICSRFPASRGSALHVRWTATPFAGRTTPSTRLADSQGRNDPGQLSATTMDSTTEASLKSARSVMPFSHLLD